MRLSGTFAPAIALCGMVMVSCSMSAGQQGDESIKQPTDTSVPLASATETQQTPMLTATAEVGQVSTSTVAATLVVFPMPTCERGTLVFTADVYPGPHPGDDNQAAQGDIYAICQDGRSLRKILSSDEFAFDSLAVSPDGRRLAVSAMHKDSSTLMSTLFILNLDTFALSKLRTLEQPSFQPRWSADDQYLAYLIHSPTPSETPPTTHVEILHLASGVTSEINSSGLFRFDWAPDGVKAVFGASVIPEEEPYGLEVYKVYVGDITCDNLTYECQLSDAREVPNIASEPSWLPDAEALVSVVRTFDMNKLLITDLQGSIVQEIDLDTLTPSETPAMWPRVSSNGRYIAFIGADNLQILDLNTMTPMNVVPSSDSGGNFVIGGYDWLD